MNDYVKIQLKSIKFHHSDTVIKCMGYLDDIAYPEDIEKYSYNKEVANGFMVVEQTLKSGHLKFAGKNEKTLENKGGIIEFKKFNDELDEFRNEKLVDIIPELKEVYEWAEVELPEVTSNPHSR
jgi:hypothetical protein